MMKDDQSRQTALGIAQDYEQMARNIERAAKGES
jgi:hypothetical protein